MDPIFALMLGMQASGMITDYLGMSNQTEMVRMGQQLQQAGIESNIEQTRLQTEDETLQAMKKLRQNLGTQLAVFAARGTSTQGSALGILNESISNFYSDERARRLNLLNKETALRGQGLISTLQGMGEVSKLWSGFAQRTIKTIPTTYEGWKQYKQAFSKGFG